MSDPRPPKSPRKGKHVNIRIVFLNYTVHVFQVPVKGSGALLWDAVIRHLQLLEADYFDLEYTNSHGDDCWLEKDKTVLKQLGSADTPLRFCVKFYTPDPGLLEDELTRFLFVLQIRKDLLRGEIRCSENTAALLSSYVVQGEIGDYDPDEYPDPTYLTTFKFLPEHLQNHEFMAKVMDYHKQHIGESPSEADLNLLDTARKVEMYGVKMQIAKDHESVSLNLAVAHLGVLVFQQHIKINTFSWAKVRKLSFKRKKFLIKLHPDTYGYYKDTVEFIFDTRDRCKLFWKRCIEHHAFFRCQVVARTPKAKSRVVSRGSSFRYTGKTQKQLVEFVRENIGKRPHFERSTSGRISSRSTSMTPKIATKPGMHSSSADLHTSSGSRSSGSHILDSNHTPNSGMHSTPQSAMRVESVDVHSDSSMSGSRSLNSPRLEHGLSIDQDVIEAVNARTEGAMTDDDDEDQESSKQERQRLGPSAGMTHVASETKGAPQCVVSPELSSPVRYVGLYSDVCSLDHCDEGDKTTSSDLDSSNAGMSSSSVDKSVIVEKVGEGLAGERDGVILKEKDCVSVVSASLEGGAKRVSLLSDSSSHANSTAHVSRSNLDLKLPTTNTHVTSQHPSPSLTNGMKPSATSPVLDQPRPQGKPPIPPATIYPSSTATSSLPIQSRSHHSTSGSSSSSCTTSIPSSSSYSVSSPSASSSSASQNSAKKRILSNTSSTPNAKSKSPSINDPAVVRKKKPDITSLTSLGNQSPSLKDSLSTVEESRQVRSLDLGQHQQQPASSSSYVKTPSSGDQDLSPPFPSPPPPLTPQQLEEEMRRHSLDASPSSCITDTAAQMRQSHQVRLSSTCKVSTPLDFHRDSPIARSSSDSFANKCSTSTITTAITPTTSTTSTTSTRAVSCSTTTTTAIIEKPPPPRSDAVKVVKPIVTKKAGPVRSASTPIIDGKSKEAEQKPPKIEKKIEKVANGQAVGAMSLDRPKECQRKLSAGTDLIEDIPYILHRRLDGNKQETAVFKVSQIDKVKIDQKTKSQAATKPNKLPEELRRARSLDRQSSPSGGSTTPSTIPSSKSKSPLDRSPSLTRRLEFVHVHTLPSRNSYSSVDDTTSPSQDGEILRQLEMGPGTPKTPVSHLDEGSEIGGANASGLEDAPTNIEEESKGSLNVTADQHSTAQSDQEEKEEDKGKERAKAETEKPADTTPDTTALGKTDEKHAHVTNSDDNDKAQNDTNSVKEVVGGHNVEKPLPVRKITPPEEKQEKADVLKTPSEELASTEAVQFYSPKIPGTCIFRKVLRSSTSDDSPESVQLPPCGAHSVSSSTSSENVSENDKKKPADSDTSAAPSVDLFFEVAKPHAQNGKTTVGPSLRPQSVNAENEDTAGHVVSKQDQSGTGVETPGISLEDSQKSPVTEEDSQHPQTLDVGSISVSELTMPHDNQFLIDLPSPAAALFYCDSDSSPPHKSGASDTASALTFSTFRPDPSEEMAPREDSSIKEHKSKLNRWSLHSVQESEEELDYKVIISEGGGIVEKSALKKRRRNDGDKPKEPKRVSWHEDGDTHHSYLSDISMTALRSPVDDLDSTGTVFSSSTTPIDSRDILETLENLRRQNSESDMTNSGSSISSSEGSDVEDETCAKQVYLEYAESKGFNMQSSEGTVDSGLGVCRESQGRETSPLRSLESVGPMISSGGSFGDRFYLEEHNLPRHPDCSPLEQLECLTELNIDDNFDDDEGEADDEDDEPNYPPPPPIMEFPDEMLASTESDMLLPPYSYASQDPLDCLEGASSSRSSMNVACYSSDSDNDVQLGAQGWRHNRTSIDPLAALELGDLMGELNCTTSESESDFDADDANVKLRRMSGSDLVAMATNPMPHQERGHRKKPPAPPPSRHGNVSSKGHTPPPPVKKKAPKVMAKPKIYPSQSHASSSINLLRASPAQGQQSQEEATIENASISGNGRRHPPEMKSSSSSPSPSPHSQRHPAPSPTVPQFKTPIRQPQMGLGMHYERVRHESGSPRLSSTSSNSSSDGRHWKQGHS